MWTGKLIVFRRGVVSLCAVARPFELAVEDALSLGKLLLLLENKKNKKKKELFYGSGKKADIF